MLTRWGVTNASGAAGGRATTTKGNGGGETMPTQYRTADTSTIAGLRQAERLHAAGWKMGSVGLFRIQFYKAVPRAPRAARAQRKP